MGDKIVQMELEGEPLKFCTTCLVDRSQVSMHCSVQMYFLHKFVSAYFHDFDPVLFVLTAEM